MLSGGGVAVVAWRMRNWSGTYEFHGNLVAPATIDEARAAVAASGKVRPLGTRHSFTDIADTDGTLLSVLDLPAGIDLDADTVTLGGGVRYGELAAWLEERGRALHNMGSLPHISVAGAVSTGTHGSGLRNGSLSTAVRSLTLIGPDGDLRTVTTDAPDFAGSVVSLGRLGPIVRVGLATEPSYRVRQDVYLDLAWDDLLADPLGVLGAGYSVSVFTDWVRDTVQQVWVKTRVDTDADDAGIERFGLRPATRQVSIIETAGDNTTLQGSAGPWAWRLPHFRLDATPSDGEEIQTEFFVPVEAASDALRAVRALGPRIAPELLVTELRTIAADDLWLSPAYRRDSLAIHFTWTDHVAAVDALVPLVRDALAPFAARPHWGKVHAMTADTIAPLYPRFADALALFHRVDPEGKFRNAHTDRVLGG